MTQLSYQKQLNLESLYRRRLFSKLCDFFSRFACLFVFDKEASNELQNNYELGNFYATQLADFASRYTAHANILITNAGVEMWSEKDQISFDVDNTNYSPMQLFLPRFQTYLANTKKELFGTVYTVGVLISNKGSPLVGGGYSQGPANTTWGKI